VLTYGLAQPADLSTIAELFQQAFPEALETVFGRPRIPPAAVEDAFSILYRMEPDGFFVAREQGTGVAYGIVVRDFSRLKRRLLWGGRIFPLVWRFLSGRYRGIGFSFILRLLKAGWDYRKADRLDEQKDQAQVLSIAVAKEWRRHGIGEELTRLGLEHLAQQGARAVRLEVHAEKQEAVALYRKLGFREKGRILSPRGAALVMIRSLP